ncbi:MAG: DUF397 domain-containing protein [Actinomadura sp.]
MEGRWMAVRPSGYSSLIWRKSRASGGDTECVEVARFDRSMLVRDSRDSDGEPLVLSNTQWRQLLTRIRNGELDLC